MSETKENSRENRIEAAMSRERNMAESKAGATDRESDTLLGRREYDQALTRRLEQLKTAMGDDQQMPIAVPSPSEPSPSVPSTTQAIGHSTTKLLLVSGFSVLLGAGLTWHAKINIQKIEPPPLQINQPVASITPAVSTPAPLPAPEKEASPAPQPKPTNEQEVGALLERWRQAWASRDIEAYLNFYSPEFVPEGQSLNKWTASRRTKLASQSEISLQIREIRIDQIDEQRMKVFFLQDYASGNYREEARAKTLLLKNSDKGWLIVGEQQAAKTK